MTKTPDKLSCILEKFHNKAIDIQKLSFEEWGLAYDNLEIQAIKSIEELFSLPERREEYTTDPHATRGCYSHTKEGKRYFDLEDNQGFNECLDEIRKRRQESKEGKE